MSKLKIFGYNTGFGDAIHVMIPDRDPKTHKETVRSILIDVGIKKGIGGASLDDIKTVINNIKKRLNGRSVDLYIMTHEHYDHVAGLFHAKDTWDIKLNVDYTWITGSANPAYLKRNPGIRELRQRMRLYCEDMERRIALVPDAFPKALAELLATRESQKTDNCVDYIRTLAKKRTTYVHAGTRIKAGTHHPFHEVRFKILAPEKNLWQPLHQLNILPLTASPQTVSLEVSKVPASEFPSPPKGVDQDAFHNLLNQWNSGIPETILAIHKAENNLSIVFMIEWRGWRLLFTGDAEKVSWRIMEEKGALKPIHFIKVSHHGSANGTPGDSGLEAILPKIPPDNRKRCALVSTYSNSKAYPEIPDKPTLDQYKKRCKNVYNTEMVKPGSAINISFQS